MKIIKPSLFAVMLFSLFFMTSCYEYSKKDIIGTWSRPFTEDIGNPEETPEVFADEYLIFNEDMSFITKLTTREDNIDIVYEEGTWELDRKNKDIITKVDGKETVMDIWYISGNKLTLSIDGENIDFEKQD